MKFEKEFKKKVYEANKASPDIVRLVEELEKDVPNEIIIRYILEDGLEDPSLDLKELLIDDGDRIVHNSKASVLMMRQKVYNEFMEALTEDLDRRKQVVGGMIKNE